MLQNHAYSYIMNNGQFYKKMNFTLNMIEQNAITSDLTNSSLITYSFFKVCQ